MHVCCFQFIWELVLFNRLVDTVCWILTNFLVCESSTIFFGITPLVFFVKSNEVIILEMSSLLTKLKLNSFIDLKTDLILSMLGCISYFLIAFTSGSLQGRFEVSHLSLFDPLVVSWKYVLKRYIFRNYLFALQKHNFVVKICDFISKEGLSKFQKFWKMNHVAYVSENGFFLTFRIKLTTYADLRFLSVSLKHSLKTLFYQTICTYDSVIYLVAFLWRWFLKMRKGAGDSHLHLFLSLPYSQNFLDYLLRLSQYIFQLMFWNMFSHS